jgi:hypothetical protein
MVLTMVLFVDETENSDFFIVAGLLLDSQDTAATVMKRFKNKAYHMPVAKRDKASLFTEFKSVLLDRHYQRIKVQMIETLLEADPRFLYACHIKGEARFTQELKENAYLSMLSAIIQAVGKDVNIVFDSFNKPEFEARILEMASTHGNVITIRAEDSQREPGLQLADNVCSVLRLHKSGTDVSDFYDLIKNFTVSVDMTVQRMLY